MELLSQNNLSETQRDLINRAIEVRNNAYCPYSGYKVGAALIDINNNIHTGCNIESADYTLTSHAEMVAVDSMVKSGVHTLKILAVAARGLGNTPATPCGLCRQKISEFDKKCESEIILVNLDDSDSIVNIFTIRLNQLLPYSFNSEFI